MTLVPVPLRDEVARKVQNALDKHQPRKYRVEVDKDAILQESGWFHVVVKTENDRRDRDFYDALAEAEADLNDDSEQQDQFLLVPAIASD
jgi:hypothetical protein